jgi:2-oxoglutarate dehydrogenase E1 component
MLTAIGAKHKRPNYAGRAAAASPATGRMSRHLAEQETLINAALDLKVEGVRFVAE